MNTITAPTIILASSSPRRQELVRMLNVPFEIIVSDADERTEPGLAPDAIVETLAQRKAGAVYERVKAEGKAGIVVGSDTIVVIKGAVLGKPRDEKHAFAMLRQLQGETHRVYTGIACMDAETGRTRVAHRMTEVTMKPLTDEQIRRYIETGEPMDKAGSYGVQGLGATFVDRIEGDYFNVVGLSLALLANMLAQLDYTIM